MPKVGWIKTTGYLTIVIDGKPTVIKAGTDRYKIALRLINKNDTKALQNFVSSNSNEKLASYTKGDFKVQGSKIVEKTGSDVPPYLSKRLVEFTRNGYPYTAIKRFWDNLKKNPNKESVDQLFLFLEAGHFPITVDGCFLAYKYVTEKDGHLYDSHTMTYKNDPGCVVVMDRSKCDPDRRVTCSHGLHVAAYEYAKDCGSGHVILEVKVNPKDVVAVPNDYNNTKMRVCKYEVLHKGNKEVRNSYLSSKYIAGKTPAREIVSKDSMELSGKTASEIVALVKSQTGEKIKFSLKSKKAILRKAKELLQGHGLGTKEEVVDISTLSGAEIISLVKEKTGEVITLSPKSKQSVIRKAEKILGDRNYQIKK